MIQLSVPRHLSIRSRVSDAQQNVFWAAHGDLVPDIVGHTTTPGKHCHIFMGNHQGGQKLLMKIMVEEKNMEVWKKIARPS
jgi:hypothetical protein